MARSCIRTSGDSLLSSEPESFASGRRPAGGGRAISPHFVLTLPHLELLYSQSCRALLNEVLPGSADPVAAHEAIQEAFAAAAKARFAFRSEEAVLAWLRLELSSRALAGLDSTAIGPTSSDPPLAWSDVLRRAQIATSQPTARRRDLP